MSSETMRSSNTGKIERGLDETIGLLKRQSSEEVYKQPVEELLPILPKYQGSTWVEDDSTTNQINYEGESSLWNHHSVLNWRNNPLYEGNSSDYSLLPSNDEGSWESDELGSIEERERRERIYDNKHDASFWWKVDDMKRVHKELLEKTRALNSSPMENAIYEADKIVNTIADGMWSATENLVNGATAIEQSAVNVFWSAVNLGKSSLKSLSADETQSWSQLSKIEEEERAYRSELKVDPVIDGRKHIVQKEFMQVVGHKRAY